jgi:hypothetical protein
MTFEITESGEYFTAEGNTAPPGEPRNQPWTLFLRVPPYPLQVATVGFYSMTEFLPDVSVGTRHARKAGE